MSNKIKRPMNAYMIFSKEKRAEIIQQKPELKSKIAEVAKLIGNYWKEMTNEDKQKYQNLATDDKKDMQMKFKNKNKLQEKPEWKKIYKKRNKLKKNLNQLK